MRTSSELAYGTMPGAPCSPGGESEWQPTDQTFVSERSPCIEMHSRNPSASLSPFSRRRGDDPAPRTPTAETAKDAALEGQVPLFRALSECEQELVEIADRLSDDALTECSRKLGLLVAEARAFARASGATASPRQVRPKAPPSTVQRVVFVRSGRHYFGLIESSVGDAHRLSAEDAREHIEFAFGARVYRGPDHLLPLINLCDVLGEPASSSNEKTEFVSAKFGEQPFGLVVDEILSTEAVPVSPMHSVLRKVGLYQGATRKSDGKCALVIDIAGVAAKGGMARLSMLPAALLTDVEPQP